MKIRRIVSQLEILIVLCNIHIDTYMNLIIRYLFDGVPGSLLGEDSVYYMLVRCKEFNGVWKMLIRQIGVFNPSNFVHIEESGCIEGCGHFRLDSYATER